MSEIACACRFVNPDRQYKEHKQIPKAEPWVNLVHDKTSLQTSIKCAKKDLKSIPDGSIIKPILKRNVKRSQGKLHYVQKQQTRQCHFVDHVIEQMAGGTAFLEDFLRYLLTKGPSSTKYCDLLPELNGIDNQKLLKTAREVHKYPQTLVQILVCRSFITHTSISI